MLYKNIMLATDGSDVANAAAEEVIKFAEDQDVNLRIVHVIDKTFIYNAGPGFDYVAFIAALRAEGQKVLDSTASIIQQHSSIKFEKLLLELQPLQGRVAETIMEEAKIWPADLLVIGTHGRRGFSRFFLGSVAENITRIATMPVLLVHGSSA